MKRLPFILLIVATFLFGSGNPDPYPEDYFRSPVGIPLRLAGSFAEMRSNHFHSGLDIKTNSRPGYRVYAAADGWISRISVSPTGFGNVLYVSHPNGYMTVYAHLDEFEEPVQSFVRELQYSSESFDIQYFPTRDQFPVQKGQVIAFSGNSGSSSGPHLHFEVRDERTGWPIDPQLFDFDIPDSIPPKIYRLKIYAGENDGRVRIHDRVTGGIRVLEAGESVVLDVTRNNGIYQLSRVDLIETAGAIRFGLQTHDFHNGSNNRLGAFRISFSADDERIFESTLDRFSFGQTRYINAHIDYEERTRSGRWIQRSHVLPGNHLPVYESRERGIIRIEPGETAELKYVVEDIAGNSSEFRFRVAGVDHPARTPVTSRERSPFILRHDAPFSMSRSGARVRIPSGAVYQDHPFEYSLSSDRPEGSFGAVHQIHDSAVPVHKSFRLALAAREVPTGLESKLTLARVGRNGSLAYAGGRYEDDAVVGNLRRFGAYTIALDDTEPTIRPLNITDGQNMSRRSSIRIRIRDDFSGIDTYRGMIDGEWVLFEYDAKYRLLTHTFSGDLDSGRHLLTLEVSDRLGNTATKEIVFTR